MHPYPCLSSSATRRGFTGGDGGQFVIPGHAEATAALCQPPCFPNISKASPGARLTDDHHSCRFTLSATMLDQEANRHRRKPPHLRRGLPCSACWSRRLDVPAMLYLPRWMPSLPAAAFGCETRSDQADESPAALRRSVLCNLPAGLHVSCRRTCYRAALG